ncbi:MAG: hypothetical protein GXY44_03035 [Phycisphaerales bacterium]|nr:hypothetical protein [Phycisphaerales bacterium]
MPSRLPPSAPGHPPAAPRPRRHRPRRRLPRPILEITPSRSRTRVGSFRNLAQRAAQAAKETTGLIENSVNKSREGADAIKAIVGGVAKVTELINGIAKASDEQAQGVDQVNTAVAQMDKVTQQNASGAEESASAAEELSAQAAATKGLVDELIVLVQGSQNTSESTTRHRPGGAYLQYTESRKAPAGKNAAVRKNTGQTVSAGATAVHSGRHNSAHEDFPSLDDGKISNF